MSNNVNLLVALLGGAVLGAGVALMFAPEKGEDLRARIKKMLKEKGMCCCDKTIDEIVEGITEKENA